MMRRRERRRRKNDDDGNHPLSDLPTFDVTCPIPALPAISNLQRDLINHLNTMESKWQHEDAEKRARKKEEKESERKKNRRQEKMAALERRRLNNITSNTDSNSTTNPSNTDSPTKRNTFSIATNTKLYMDHLIDSRRASEQLISDIRVNMLKQEAATAAYRAEKLRLLRLQIEGNHGESNDKENIPPS